MTAPLDPTCATVPMVVPASAPRDHVVASPAREVAVISDRGLRRTRNEDAGAAVIAGGWLGLVVCDGVGSTPGSDRAAQAATAAARAALLRAHGDGHPLADQLPLAVRAAARAAEQTAGGSSRGERAPATTLVAAVSDGRTLAAVTVGDSRVYWVPDHGPAIALTTDDSFAAEQLALGARPDEVARSPFAHLITRWLGAGSPPADARVTTVAVSGPGWLLACSDGLWGYLAPGWDLTGVTAGADPDDGLTVAERLVAWANAQGGRDNITVALGRIDAVPDAVPAAVPAAA